MISRLGVVYVKVKKNSPHNTENWCYEAMPVGAQAAIMSRRSLLHLRGVTFERSSSSCSPTSKSLVPLSTKERTIGAPLTVAFGLIHHPPLADSEKAIKFIGTKTEYMS